MVQESMGLGEESQGRAGTGELPDLKAAGGLPVCLAFASSPPPSPALLSLNIPLSCFFFIRLSPWGT